VNFDDLIENVVSNDSSKGEDSISLKKIGCHSINFLDNSSFMLKNWQFFTISKESKLDL
jgi:hypothetical protein